MLTRMIMVVVVLEALVAVGIADGPAGKASPPKEPNWEGGKLALEPLGQFPSALDEFAKVWREESLPLLSRFKYRDANAVITAYIGRPPKNTRCLVAALLAQYGIRREMRDVPGGHDVSQTGAKNGRGETWKESL